MRSLKLVSAPAEDPVSLSEIKNYLRISVSTDDAMLTGFITAATRLVEAWLNRKLVTQTWDLFDDCFPEYRNFDALKEGWQEGALSEYISQKDFISIPFFPLQSVTFLKTFDEDDTEFTMPSSDYQVDTISEPGRLALRLSATWPTTVLRTVNGINIRFVCGYGTASAVPYPIKQAIQMMVGKFYESRGCDDSSIPNSVMAILAPYRVMRI